MLKRSVALVLMMLYVVTVFGSAPNSHDCSNRHASVKVNTPANPCVKALETSKVKCCKDKHIEVKVNDTHQAGSPSFWAKFFSFGPTVSAFTHFLFTFQNPLPVKLVYSGQPFLLQL